LILAELHQTLTVLVINVDPFFKYFNKEQVTCFPLLKYPAEAFEFQKFSDEDH